MSTYRIEVAGKTRDALVEFVVVISLWHEDASGHDEWQEDRTCHEHNYFRHLVNYSIVAVDQKSRRLDTFSWYSSYKLAAVTNVGSLLQRILYALYTPSQTRSILFYVDIDNSGASYHLSGI